MRFLFPLLLLAACPAERGGSVRRPSGSDPGTDSAALTTLPTDVGDSAADTPALPTTAGPSLCFLGDDRAGTTCVPTVVADAAWGSDYAYPSPLSGDLQYAAPTHFLDLDALSPTLALAPNFLLNELAQAYKGRFAVVQPHLLDALQGIRDDGGFVHLVTSGYRSPAYNAGVGGVTYSRHQYGDGVDLYPNDGDLEALGTRCTTHGASYVQLYSGHVHCDWREHTLDPVLFAAASVRSLATDPVLTGPAEPLDAILHVDRGVWTAPANGFDEGEPLRRWTFFDAEGQPVHSQLGPEAAAPAQAVRVQVVVGGQLTLEQTL